MGDEKAITDTGLAQPLCGHRRLLLIVAGFGVVIASAAIIAHVVLIREATTTRTTLEQRLDRGSLLAKSRHKVRMQEIAGMSVSSQLGMACGGAFALLSIGILKIQSDSSPKILVVGLLVSQALSVGVLYAFRSPSPNQAPTALWVALTVYFVALPILLAGPVVVLVGLRGISVDPVMKSFVWLLLGVFLVLGLLAFFLNDSARSVEAATRSRTTTQLTCRLVMFSSAVLEQPIPIARENRIDCRGVAVFD
jgi:hypothetical protein